MGQIRIAVRAYKKEAEQVREVRARVSEEGKRELRANG